MKNIILVDVCECVVEAIADMEDVFISVLVVDKKDQGIELKEKYKGKIGEIYCRIVDNYNEYLELNNSNYNITYDDIQRYRTTQLKVERYTTREVLNISEIQYRYYNALRYWLGVFDKYKIDAVISMHQEHGAVWDSIPYDIAISRNIPVYVSEIQLGNHSKSCFVLRCLNNLEIINLKSVITDYPKTHTDNYFHNVRSQLGGVKLTDKKNVNFFLKQLYRAFRLWLKNLFIPVDKCFYKETNNYEYWYNLRPDEIVKNTLFINNLKKQYNAIASKPVKDEKYIYYALHLEPEATILNRGALSSQLFIIELLAKNLPEGWKLYVKEHPCQFKLVDILFYILRNISFFRNSQFYRNIVDLPNTKLIGLDVSSKELISNAQINASITGTVLFESILSKKNTMIFGNNTCAFSEVNDTFVIKSEKDIINAIEMVKNGFKPEFGNFSEVVENLTYEIEAGEICKNANAKHKKFFQEIINVLLNKPLDIDITTKEM